MHYGTEIRADGSTSEGHFKNKMLNGKGEMKKLGGIIMRGDFVNNELHGQGKQKRQRYC